MLRCETSLYSAYVFSLFAQYFWQDPLRVATNDVAVSSSDGAAGSDNPAHRSDEGYTYEQLKNESLHAMFGNVREGLDTRDIIRYRDTKNPRIYPSQVTAPEISFVCAWR